MRRTIPWALLLAACGGASAVDAGSNDAGFDAGARDSGVADAAADANITVVDAAVDASTEPDAATPDAGGGEECRADALCGASQRCSGSGCFARWTCVPMGACTEDEVEYCGCDGLSFFDSSTCPRRPFMARGPCPTTPVNCDVRDVECFETPIPCPAGMATEVEGTCWGSCVRIERCACTKTDECPFAPEEASCASDGRCHPR
jgi:hypothetical protein